MKIVTDFLEKKRRKAGAHFRDVSRIVLQDLMPKCVIEMAVQRFYVSSIAPTNMAKGFKKVLTDYYTCTRTNIFE